MSRVGLMMVVNRAEGQMSEHFGKAPWIMVAATENGALEFVKNEALNGRSAADLLARKGCTDVILVDIGDGARGRLQVANIRVWAAPGPVTGHDALRMFAEGQLLPVPLARAETTQGAHHGCCCSSHAGAEAAGCCRG